MIELLLNIPPLQLKDNFFFNNGKGGNKQKFKLLLILLNSMSYLQPPRLGTGDYTLGSQKQN